MNKVKASYGAIFLLTVLMAEVLGKTNWRANGNAGTFLLLALGISLAITGCFYYSQQSGPKEETKTALLAFCLILFLSSLFRVADFMADHLEYDSYACMLGVGSSFAEYSKGLAGAYSFPIKLHYWVSGRLFGDTLYAFRILSWFTGIVVALAVLRVFQRQWPHRQVLAVAGLVLLVMNSNYAYLTQYAMYPYINALLVSIGIYYLCMRALNGPLQGGDKTLLWLVAVPGAFFSSVTNLVPLANGALLVFVFLSLELRAREAKEKWRPLLQTAKSLAPLVLFPATLLALALCAPFTNLGAEKRPDLAPLFFPQSAFSKTLGGAAGWIGAQSISSIATLWRPFCGAKLIRVAWIGLTAALAIIGSLAVVVNWRKECKHLKFTLCFALLTSLSICFGGLIGQYPFGKARYMIYLLLPTVVLAAVGIELVVKRLMQAGVLSRFSWRKGFAVVVTLAVVASVVACYLQIRSDTERTRLNSECFLQIRRHADAAIVLDSYIVPYVQQKVPGIAGQGTEIGLGRPWLREKNLDLLEKRIAMLRAGNDTNGVLVVHRQQHLEEEDFPRLTRILKQQKYEKAFEVNGPDISMTMFR